jgi:hypothetical protein
MTNAKLRERLISAELAWHQGCVDVVVHDNDEAADKALAALGLDDLDAFATAVGRAAWVRQHARHRIPPLAIDDIVRTGLEAALTPEKP